MVSRPGVLTFRKSRKVRQPGLGVVQRWASPQPGSGWCKGGPAPGPSHHDHVREPAAERPAIPTAIGTPIGGRTGTGKILTSAAHFPRHRHRVRCPGIPLLLLPYPQFFPNSGIIRYIKYRLRFSMFDNFSCAIYGDYFVGWITRRKSRWGMFQLVRP